MINIGYKMINSFFSLDSFDNCLERAYYFKITPLVHIRYLWNQSRNNADFALRNISTFVVLSSSWFNHRLCPGIKQLIFIGHQSYTWHNANYICEQQCSFPQGAQKLIGGVRTITSEQRESCSVVTRPRCVLL